ncbi:efflux RND transporter periplasmic adaptor subunit [Rhizobium binae]|uniref:RND family efflux transporter MFP subunit n=1 Tax=Rhizobium binae TaxID=1138190 RepID=A0ABV2MRL4_9HYPH|nr:efflux RND transporter periplasmic adaptor subunit [Rhizobium binae]NKL52270.1 efflux RND transporter periplasmic adaptor subunit [Rhizobium leguminosarum bv. viciae]MBX4927571.1 efflux RND transporter periplasmic adaptor subunit [Rhizobium binae]MBX4938911.1 efflux RND transporter periplasmic adaptor subunit [Rhizobium binae]MBX4945435.1 efflux RND transporter periplasmic adaptor subunit [Rhizobium binae]MBX4963770.1 efflux RND transporter periplasmic adaptor subunit [Rhizobium binae]
MRLIFLLTGLTLAGSAAAETLKLQPISITEWKAVYGSIEARNTVAARARIGGTIIELDVTEGESVKAGQKIAVVRDEKLAFQIAALDAQINALQSQLTTAQADLARAETLVSRGAVTVQQSDALRTQVAVTRNQITATQAQRAVIVQQQSEGEVDAPTDGKVLTVPTTKGAVIMAGETVSTVGGGGLFLRLAIPERHAAFLKQDATIRISVNGRQSSGKLVKIYPEIDNGRVIADVEADQLETSFVEARVLVEVPVGERSVLLVPVNALITHSGLDFVKVAEGAAVVERTVITGEHIDRPGGRFIEILTGLAAGDEVVLP